MYYKITLFLIVMNIELLSVIVSIVALAIALFSITIAFIFYFRTSDLYNKTIETLASIKTISETIYSGQYDLIKDAWPHLWESGDSSSAEKTEREQMYEKMKNEILDETQKHIKKNIENIQKKGVKKPELDKELKDLEKKVETITKKMLKDIDEVEKDRRFLADLTDKELTFIKLIKNSFEKKIFRFSEFYNIVEDKYGYTRRSSFIILKDLVQKGVVKKITSGPRNAYQINEDIIDLVKKL